NWRAALRDLAPGRHTLAVEVTGPGGVRATTARAFEVCTSAPRRAASAADWPELGGGNAHRGATAHAIAPPLATRWIAPLRGHVVTAPPVVAGGVVYVAVSDLADGDTGAVVALELSTGDVRWRARTDKPIRGGVAFVAESAGAPATLVTTQIDGTVLGLDAATGETRWRREISRELPP